MLVAPVYLSLVDIETLKLSPFNGDTRAASNINAYAARDLEIRYNNTTVCPCAVHYAYSPAPNSTVLLYGKDSVRICISRKVAAYEKAGCDGKGFLLFHTSIYINGRHDAQCVVKYHGDELEPLKSRMRNRYHRGLNSVAVRLRIPFFSKSLKGITRVQLLTQGNTGP